LTYFKKGCVQEVEEISTGQYEAVVSGTDDYLVLITLQKGIVTDCNCNYPYE
jgi:uncharacterized Zn finger protein